MVVNPKSSVCFISSFLPQQCGIANFTNDLINAIRAKVDYFSPFVVAVRAAESAKYGEPVKFDIRRDIEDDYRSAADYINFSPARVVSLQHEYGIFGGDQGDYLLLLLRRLRLPVVTTLHTVLDTPSDTQRKVLSEIADISYRVVVMSRQGISMLTDVYSVPQEKIVLLPHGIPDLPQVNPDNYKHKFGLGGRKIILTFGLISRNKGIEVMIKALPDIVSEDPSVLYAVVGVTHPNVKLTDGEEYRLSLQRLVAELGLAEHVMFYNHFVKVPELYQWLCAADFYVTPYLYAQQLTSGTLAFALGSGKAIISTPYWYAEELLADGRGRLVPFGDSQAVAENILELLRDPREYQVMRKRAYAFGRKMTWPRVGARYWKLFNEPKRPVKTVIPTAALEQASSVLDLPPLKLDHLIRLTDEVGLIQHARFIVPDRVHGYCTDDNARALEVVAKYCRNKRDKEVERLLNIYLGFVCHAQRSDGTFQNFVSFDRKFVEPDVPGDALSRAILGLGAVLAYPPTPAYLPFVKDCFDRAASHLPVRSLRGQAYSIAGLSYYLQQFCVASDVKKLLRINADLLVSAFRERSVGDWLWFEDQLTYDNAALPNALFLAAKISPESSYLEIAIKTCGFLLSHTYDGRCFSFVGNKGWLPRGGSKADFDQQPIEAAGTVLMLRAAYQATGRAEYLNLMRKAFDWFLGDNGLQKPVYDLVTGGCADALIKDGVNVNQGAESLLSFLRALICVQKSYTSQNSESGSK
ncbi:MAG: glycosyltransferase [Actinobacteria bacterium]|nr:glycosyltransferase [Actinomycetota bacterium]